MIIRVSGGKRGITEYLQTGKKKGRKNSRDELDDRVPLYGDIFVTDQVIRSMSNKGDKYLHITLGFKEDHIDIETIEQITEEAVKFFTSAYQEDEISVYAERHSPRIKTILDETTDETIIRRDHVHMVIPRLNLVNGLIENPLGKYKDNEHYVKAFQEYINQKYGLESPDENKRQPGLESTYISNYMSLENALSGDKETIEQKRQMLSHILEEDMNYEDFKSYLATAGAMKIRNQGKTSEYLNIKFDEQKKGINLKETIFREEFLNLPLSEKQAYLQEKLKVDTEYREPARKEDIDEKNERILTEWHSKRAKEIKFLRPNSEAFKVYRKLKGKLEKQQFLQEQIDAFNTKWFPPEPQPEPIEDAVEDLVKLLPPPSPERIEKANYLSGELLHQHTNYCIQQFRKMQQIQKEKEDMKTFDMKVIKSQLNANLLLEELEQTHGVIREKYHTFRHADQSWRISAGSRNYNVSDFLTKEIGLVWEKAKAYLQSVYQKQSISQQAQDGQRFKDEDIGKADKSRESSLKKTLKQFIAKTLSGVSKVDLIAIKYLDNDKSKTLKQVIDKDVPINDLYQRIYDKNLYRQNLQNDENIYFAFNEESLTDIVWLDDIDPFNIDSTMTLIETSPNNYQAFIKLDRQVNFEEARRIKKVLTEQYEADKGALGANQPMRFAGFLSNKPTSKFNDRFGRKTGYDIGVKQYSDVRLDTEDLLLQYEFDYGETDYDNQKFEGVVTRQEPSKKRKDFSNTDQSAQDASYVFYLVRCGLSDSEIRSRLTNEREDIISKKKGNVDKYVNRTIEFARAKTGIEQGSVVVPETKEAKSTAKKKKSTQSQDFGVNR